MKELYSTTGSRLGYILDIIGFPIGRGRATKFANYLKEQSPSNCAFKHSAVRAWFGISSPPMRKINEILIYLESEYVFPIDKNIISVWWKLGGMFPFIRNDIAPSSQSRIEFIVAKIISESKVLKKADFETKMASREYLLGFCRAFSDPNIEDCPEQYLKIFARQLSIFDISISSSENVIKLKV